MDLASSCVVKLLCFFTFQAALFVAERHCFLRHSLWFLVLLFFFLHNWKVMWIFTVKNVNSGIYSLLIRSCCQNDMMLPCASSLVELLMVQEGFVDRQRFLFFIVSYSKSHVFITFLSMLQGYMTLSRKWVNYPTALRPHRGRKTVTVILKMKWNCIFCLFI